MKYIFSFFVFVFLFIVPLAGNATKFSVIRPSSQAINQAILSASEKTQVRAAVLYGLLGQETGYGGYLGKTESNWTSFCSIRNTPDCQNWKNYDCHDDYRNTRHLDEILTHLGYEKKDIPTSSTCALGFTQFEPNTWWEVLGGNLIGLDPWNIDDAVLMSAYYLQDLGADKIKLPKANDIFSHSDRIALQRYYCGGSYNRSECESYARGVENKARRAAPELLARDYQQQLGALEEQRSAIRKKLNLLDAPRIEVPKIEIRRQPEEEAEPPVILIITPSGTLPDGTVGTPYLIKFSADGGIAPYTWTFVFGGDDSLLPKGLHLDSAGVLFGTPTQRLSTGFSVGVTDSKGKKRRERMYISIKEPLSVLPFEFWSGRVGVPYSEWLHYVGGGYSPYTWSLISGALPPGLILSHEVFASNNDPTGIISGIPAAGGVFKFTLKVTDSRGTIVTKNGNIKIKPAPEQPISIKGRMLDRFSKNPVAGVLLRTITPELEAYEEEDVYVLSDKDGSFVTLVDGATTTAAEDVYIHHSSDCYDEEFHVLGKDQGGNLRVRVNIADFKDGDINHQTSKEFAVTASEVDVGDILLWPTVQQLIIYSDIKVGAKVEFKAISLGGQVNFENEHYLSDAIRLTIPMRVKLTDQAGNIYYSPLVTIPLDYGCKPVILRFSAGQFKWELEP